jgi:hypothetical protein
MMTPSKWLLLAAAMTTIAVIQFWPGPLPQASLQDPNPVQASENDQTPG